MRHGLALLRVHPLEQLLPAVVPTLGPSRRRATGLLGVPAPLTGPALPRTTQGRGAGGAGEPRREPGGGARTGRPGRGRPRVSATHRLATLPGTPDSPGPVHRRAVLLTHGRTRTRLSDVHAARRFRYGTRTPVPVDVR
ncbi:hypothetical protein Acsp07_03300 [Actinomycetospora sp. NBRC 106378]|nr:hypothetical protein Acsp07_03300 [Actinomycetospora sp. NBRC 106378]